MRGRVADALSVAAWIAAVIALFVGAKIDGVWLRIPLLLALLLLLPAGWFVFRKRAHKASTVLSGGIAFATAGVAVLTMAMLHASGWAALAGLLSLLAALSLRGSADKAVIRGRDVRAAKRKPITALFDQVESLAAALVLVLLVWHFGLEAFRIPSGSMAPTLLGDPVSGDRVLVDKFVYTYRDPARWEPVVFRYPLRRTDPYVKRCIALPGEEVLIAQGDVYVREPGSGKIVLLQKTARARDELWLPIIENLDSPTAWVKNFQRNGDVDFKDGVITLGGGSAVFPRGDTDDKPGNVMDHDASFGATETEPVRYGKHVVGDLRLRATITLEADGKVSVTIVRDEDSYRLELGTGAGACKLLHLNGDVADNLAVDQMGALALDEGSNHEVEFSLADGILAAALDGDTLALIDVGSPLLDQLVSRDTGKRITIAGPEALKMASAEPAEGRKARIELRGKAHVRVHSIDRDIYYIGRTLEDGGKQRELPFQVTLGDDQYFVLGDNSPGSADCRFWTRITLFLNDDTQVTGSMDLASQPELARILAQSAAEGATISALEKLMRVAHFTQAERGEDSGSDSELVADALAELKQGANAQGRAAIDFYTEGGGFVRIRLADVERVQVASLPYVERKLFVGRPFAVFLSPRGMKLID
jgi:signal peptidase I